MKYTITNYKFAICKWIALFIISLLSLSIQAQELRYKDGVLQGVVKVKFEPSMTATLSQMQIKTKGKTLSTGIATFDKAVTNIKGVRMERIIPECPDPLLEAKHRKAGLHLWYTVEFDETVDMQTAVQTLKAVPGVKLVEREYQKELIPTTITPYTPTTSTKATLPFNDPYLKDQWHYINTGQLDLEGERADVNLGEAWKVTAGRPDVVVAVFDEGVDVTHDDLKGNLWTNTKEIPGNGIDDDGNGYIDDVHGFNFVKLTGSIDPQSHGTHVAGTVAAVNNNGIGVSGVAGGTGNNDGAKIMSLQIIGGAKAGHMFKAYVYAADMGAVISQNSWGYTEIGAIDADVKEGIDYFIENAGSYDGSPMKGGIVIFAAGNSSADAEYWPGIYERCFAVSAIGPQWKIASYSNYGKWIEISAPGGDTDYGVKAGVLSTMPGNQYGYMDGTSMACPHVSGIAALALASSQKQMTNTELWQKLLTSVTEVDKYNDPWYAGKLGVGAISALLAVKNDGKKSPESISTLAIKGIAQEFATLEWKVPSDPDDEVPYSFTVYYSTEPITIANLNNATQFTIANKSKVGEVITSEIQNLSSTTMYYFAVISADRWGNISGLSNVVSATTNNGPSIDVNTGAVDKSISLSVNTATSTSASTTFELLNNAEGALRWEASSHNSGHTFSPVAYSASVYPKTMALPKGIGTKQIAKGVKSIRPTDISTLSAFVPIEKRYAYSAEYFIGDTDPSLPTSGAVRFIVTEEDGFNLTQIDFSVSYSVETGPLLVEIYKDDLKKENLYYTEKYTPSDKSAVYHNVVLKDHIYFPKGSEFYIVVHVPGGNGYSLGIGPETSSEYSDYCYYSSNYGANWEPISTVGISQVYAWEIVALSQCENISEFITLDPSSGDVSGNAKDTISLTANGAELINGTYQANILFKSNDSENPQYRMPIKFEVSGHKPNIIYPKVVEFGSVFLASEATLDIVLQNVGYGLITNLTTSVDNSQFTIESSPWEITARNESKVRVKFKPSVAGNVNGKLTVTNGQNTYQISLFGVGAETSKIELNPTSGSYSGITIGDEVEANFTIKNTGGYPLKYFIPGFDMQGIGNDWPSDYHSYGYAVRSNRANLTSDATLTYVFNDISATGVDITDHFVTNMYKEVEFGFDFPYYGTVQKKFFITKNGFTTFDDSSYPYNQPKLKGDLRGYISILGFGSTIDLSSGKILYKAESDRFILQYTNIKEEGFPMTVQMVLFANGNIRFYYKDIPASGDIASSITVMIEDIDQTDGILLKDYFTPFALESLTVIGFDYPGPSIITSIENGSGIIAPNGTANVKVKMNTDSLSEGAISRNVNIISNDPTQINANYIANLDVVAGGAEKYVVSTDSIYFGTVYQGHTYSKEFAIRNIGTKPVTISSFIYDNTKFSLSGSSVIAPGLNEIYTISPITTNIVELSDDLTINFANGDIKQIELKASVLGAPIAVADLNGISASLNIGDRQTFPFEIKNTGISDLDFSVIGGQWFRFEETSSSSVKDYGYKIKRENSGEPSYNWVDILKTGTKCPYDPDNNEKDKTIFWHDVSLPFAFQYYGIEYNSIKIGDNGLIALGGDPKPYTFPSSIPITDEPNTAFIYPMWSPGGFDEYNHPEDAGLYYQVYDDKVVITWMYFMNLFGWGQSAQTILFKDGSIKFQYKLSTETSDGTGSGVVGLQNIGETDYTVISDRNRLLHGEGLAYVIVPDNTHVIAPNDKVTGNIILDATNIYGGVFNDSLCIRTNDPALTELVKPLQIIVAGSAVVDVPTEIDLGDLEVVQDIIWGYQYTMQPLVIKNTGTAPFKITSARMETGGQYLTQLIYVSSLWGNMWTPIENLFMGYPQQLLLPGASFNTYVRFMPEQAGAFEDVLILETTIGDIKIKLKGLGYTPAVIDLDETPINVSFNTSDQTEDKTVAFNNANGGYRLNYNAYIEYERNAPVETTSLSEKIVKSTQIDTSVVAVSRSVLNKVRTKSSITPYADDFNRKIQYIKEEDLNNGIGNQGTTTTITGTKFIADKTGFTLSDVGSYVAVHHGFSGTVTAEIRAGGSNITNAIRVGAGSAKITYPASVKDSSDVAIKCNIKLDKPVQILPNEEFYVIFTYPMDLIYPQSMQYGGADIVADRYLWYANGSWYDMQQLMAADGGKEDLGYVTYAAERTFEESGWVKILTNESGTLQIGESSSIDIQLVGKFAEVGDQKAKLVIKSDDVNASIAKKPIVLHMNEAPVFVDVPTSIITSENEETIVGIRVKDIENNTFEWNISEKPKFATEVKNSSDSVTLTLSPDYGDAGNYKVSMKATDQYNAVREHVINIHVAKTNQAPKYIGETKILRYNAGAESVRLDIKDMFSDPDGDDMTFTVESKDKTIVEAYQSGGDYFYVEPVSAGATKLTFQVKDVYDASTTDSIDVIVESCMNPEGIIVQKWNYVLAVNNKEGKFVSYQWYKNSIAIQGANKQHYAEKDSELDFSAEYFVQLTTTDGQTVFTCPFTPVRKEISLKAYPNPVQQGESVKVETQLPDLDTKPVTIQVVNMSGNVIKTISTQNVETLVPMNCQAGSYLIRVSNGNINKTFNVIVR